MLTQNEILSRFNNVKPYGTDQYKAECPCHSSKGKQSLHITFKKDRVLFYDHGCCETQDILDKVGLTWADVQEDKEKPSLHWYERMLFGFNQHNGGGWKIHDIYHYTDESGKYLYSKIRYEKPGEDKQIRYNRVDLKSDKYETGRGDVRPTLYNLKDFLWAVSEGLEVYYVEGEKDVETLRSLGLYATTAGGTQDWKKEYSRYFTGAKVTIISDNDKVGKDLARSVTEDIRKYAYWRQMICPSRIDHGDVTDYLQKENGTKETLLEMVEACMTYDQRLYGDWLTVLKVYEKDKNGNDTEKVVDVSIKVNCDRLANIYAKGNPHLIVRRGEEPKDDVYLYDYTKGVYSLTNKNGVKTSIKQYAPLGTASDQMLNSVSNLLLCSRSHVCRWEDLDNDDSYINVENGLYSISKRELHYHTPKIKSAIQINARYIPSEKRPPFFTTLFSKYIDDLCRDPEGNVDQTKADLLQEFAGLILSNMNISKLKKMLVLCSPRGDSGKSVFLNVMTELLGEQRVANVPLQKMNENNRFSLGALKKVRLLACGDQTGAVVEDTSILKQLTGNDMVKTERKGIQEEYIHFHGGILILCNALPSFKDDKGDHLFDRLMIIPCENHFDAKKADVNLTDKLLLEKDIIFSWALEGLHRLIDNDFKFTECKAADALKKEYRSNVDTVFRFIEENGYIITGCRDDRIERTVFDEKYVNWCKDNEYNAVSPINLPNRMQSLGCPRDKGNVNEKRGISIYRCIREKTAEEIQREEAESDEDFRPAIPDDAVPFDDQDDDV